MKPTKQKSQITRKKLILLPLFLLQAIFTPKLLFSVRLKDKMFANVRVLNSLSANNLSISGLTNLNGDTTIRGNLTITGSLNGGTSTQGSVDTNQVALFADSTGTKLKGSPVTIDDSGNININGITKAGNTVSWPSGTGAVGTFLGSDGAGGLIYSSPFGGGNVSTATDFTATGALLKTDLASGVKNIKETGVILDGTNNMSGVNILTAKSLALTDFGGVNYVGLNPPFAISSSYDVNLPSTAPILSQFLKVTSGSSPFSTQWTTIDAPPATTRSFYVTLAGSEALPNDGSLSAPYRSVKKAVFEASLIATSATPIAINVGPGTFIEDNSGGPITINADGIIIKGSAVNNTTITPSTASADLFYSTKSNIGFYDFSMVAPGGSTARGVAFSVPANSRIRFINIVAALFQTGFAISNSSASNVPLIIFSGVQTAGCTFGITLSDISAVFENGLMRGIVAGSTPANTGIIVSGAGSKLYVSNTTFIQFGTAISITDQAQADILSCIIQETTNGVISIGASETHIIGCNFLLNNSSSININASGSNTKMHVQSCEIDAQDQLGARQGTCIKITGGACAIINNNCLDEASVGIECGQAGDTDTTSVFAGGNSTRRCDTCIKQAGTSKLQFTSGKIDTTKLNIGNPLNVSISSFDTDGSLAFGQDLDATTPIYKVATKQTNLPNLNYYPNFYGSKGTVYLNQNADQTLNGVIAQSNNASYYVITGDNTKQAKINLISDISTVGTGDNVAGWEISKLGNSNSDLAFTYTNNNPGTQYGPNTVMQLDGVKNQVVFPTTTNATLPVNSTPTLVWAPSTDTKTNLYRSALDTLKTDGSFVIGDSSTITIPTGYATGPSLTFAGDPNTGIYSTGPDNLSFSTAGTPRMNISPTGIVSITSLSPTGVVHNDTSGNLSSSLIINADIATGAAISDTKLDTIFTPLKVSNSATTATNANTTGAIVARDAFGDFSIRGVTAVGGTGAGFFASGTGAGFFATTGATFVGPLTGLATNATTAVNFSGTVGASGGDVSGAQTSMTINTVGGVSAANVAAGATLANNATSNNTSSAIVRRDSSGDFNIHAITATGATGGFIATGGSSFFGPLVGNANTATRATYADSTATFTTSLTGDVTGGNWPNPTIVDSIGNGARTVAQIIAAMDLVTSATSNNQPDTIVKRNSLGNFAANMITLNTGDIFAGTDATTKDYVDTQVLAGGLVPKTPVLVVSTISTNTFGFDYIDSVTVANGDRVLLIAQAAPSDPIYNGIWEARSGNWTRPSDFLDTNTAGRAYVLTTSGATQAGSSWLCSTPLAIIGTDPLQFIQFSLPGTTTGANVGSGTGQIFRDKTGQTLNFKTLAALTYMQINNQANTVEIGTNATANNTASTIIARDALGYFSATGMTGAASANVLKSGDTMTGNLILGPSGATRKGLQYQDNSGSQYIGIRAPASVSASYTIDLPDTAPITHQFLQATSPTGTAWTTIGGGLPAANKTYYVSLTGNDITGDGTVALPYRSVRWAVEKANGVSNLSNPVVVNVGPGVFYEDNSGGGIQITADAIGIVGACLGSTIIVPEHVTSDDLFVITTPNVEFYDMLITTTTPGSTKSAIKLDTTINGRGVFNSIGINNFNTAFDLGSTGTAPLIVFENVQCTDNTTAIALAGVKTVIKSSIFQGSSLEFPANTGISIIGPTSEVIILSSVFKFFDTCIKITSNGFTRISAVDIESFYNGIVCESGSKCYISGLSTILNYGNTVTIAAKDTDSVIFIEGSLFICADTLSDLPTGTAIKCINNAKIHINSSTIEKAGVGFELGTPLDSASTAIISNGVNLLFCPTDVIQSGTSTLKFVGGTIETTNFIFENPINISMASFDSNGESTISFGNTTDNDQTIYNILNAPNNFPHLMYQRDYYGSKGTVYHNMDTSPAISGIQADTSDAQYCIVTGLASKEAKIRLISDTSNIGQFDNVKGWEISKLNNSSADLAFTYTNNDTVAYGPNTVMQLNGVKNQILFPTTINPTSPTNPTPKLVWGTDGANSNLYMSALDTLKTDGSFVVGTISTSGALTLPTGPAGTPALTFAGDPNTGIYSTTGDTISFSTNGSTCMSILSTGTVLINSLAPTAGIVHNDNSGNLYSSLITNLYIATGAGITDNKLATISSTGAVANSATTATSVNTSNAIVARDINGDFNAHTITATGLAGYGFVGPLTGNVTGSLFGNADTATSAITFSSELGGDVTGFQLTTTVIKVGGKSATDIASATTLALEATDANTPGRIVRRDGTGNFSAGTITASLSGSASLNILRAGDSMLGTFTVLSGYATGPSIQFTGSTNTGLSAPTLNTLSFDTVGIERMSINATGVTLPSGLLTLPGGTAAAPTIKFSNGTNTGLSSPTGDIISFDTLATERMNISATGVTMPRGILAIPLGSASSPALTFTGNTNTGIYSSGTNNFSIATNGIQQMSFLPSTAILTTGTLTLPAGTVTSPALQFTGSVGSGISAATANTLSFDTIGIERATISSSGLSVKTGTLTVPNGSAASPAITFNSDTNTGIFFSSPDIFSITNNGTQTLSTSTAVITENLPICFGANALLVWPQFTANGTATANATTSVLMLSSNANRTVIVNFPPAPSNGQLFTIVDTNTIADSFQLNLTNSAGGATIVNEITRLNPGANTTTSQNGCYVTYIYLRTPNTWYRFGRG